MFLHSQTVYQPMCFPFSHLRVGRIMIFFSSLQNAHFFSVTNRRLSLTLSFLIVQFYCVTHVWIFIIKCKTPRNIEPILYICHKHIVFYLLIAQCSLLMCQRRSTHLDEYKLTNYNLPNCYELSGSICMVSGGCLVLVAASRAIHLWSSHPHRNH